MKVVSACRIWCLVFKLSVQCGAEGCVSGLRVTRKPDTQSKHVEQAIRSAIKIHLLHLVGILFPHIIDDARSKPHQSFNNFNLLFLATDTEVSGSIPGATRFSE
jgi:hypothetical protein